MGFHRRHIDNETVHRLFNSGGAPAVFDLYTKGVDSLVMEIGLASKISDVIGNSDWHLLGRHSMEEEIEKIIRKDLGIEEIKK